MSLLAQFWAVIRQHPLISTCLGIAILAGAANYPLWQHREKIIVQHDELQKRGQVMITALTDRERISGDLEIVGKAQDEIDRNLVTEDSMEVNIGYFYRLEKLNRVRLIRVDQLGSAPVTPGQLFKTVPVSLQASGTYRNLLAFLRELETGPRLLRIVTYRLDRSDAPGAELQLSLTVELLAKS